MSSLDEDLNQRLAEIREQGLHRRLRNLETPQGPHIRLDGQALVNFASNDYLGLANHPVLVEAAQRAAAEFGAGSGASRLVCGSLQPHRELEERLATFKGTSAALSFGSGYSAAVGLLEALMERGDVIICDRLIHASLIDGARLSRAEVRVFGHNDLNELEHILQTADQPVKPAGKRSRKLILTESVFSMDGDFAALREIVQLKERYGAWLLLDEAHATGLFGQHRRGLAEAFGLGDQIDIHMGTLGKALGSAGGYFCGSRPLIEFLVNKARTFIFSTAPPPAAAAAASAAIGLVESPEGEERRAHLWARVDDAKNGLINNRWPLPPIRSAILPVMLGQETLAVQLADELRDLGCYVPAIRYPSVARGAARLRLTLTAAHTPVDVAALVAALTVCRSRATRDAEP